MGHRKRVARGAESRFSAFEVRFSKVVIDLQPRISPETAETGKRTAQNPDACQRVHVGTHTLGGVTGVGTRWRAVVDVRIDVVSL